jgi:hypothetical protein
MLLISKDAHERRKGTLNRKETDNHPFEKQNTPMLCKYAEALHESERWTNNRLGTRRLALYGYMQEMDGKESLNPMHSKC